MFKPESDAAARASGPAGRDAVGQRQGGGDALRDTTEGEGVEDEEGEWVTKEEWVPRGQRMVTSWARPAATERAR